MELFYYRDPDGNFGDDLNAWLWERLLPGLSEEPGDVGLLGIGTIIGMEIPPVMRVKVFTSGAGYSRIPRDFGSPRWEIVGVRGPLTAQVLNLPARTILTDGALLLRLLPEYQPLPEAERSGVVFMPHHRALCSGNWEEVCNRAGIEFVSPRDDSRHTLRRLARAKLVLADAMHAAICADALRVPWVPLAISLETPTFKWLDWTLSHRLPYEPLRVPPCAPMEAWRRLVAAFRGEHRLLTDQGASRARQHLRHQQDIVKDNFIRRLDGALTKNIVRYLGWEQSERHMDAAAQALRRAATLPGYLSTEAIQQRLLAELTERLGKIAPHSASVRA